MKYLLFCLLIVSFVRVSAQEIPDGADPYPTILLCEDGQGCRHSPISGELSYRDAAIALGEPEVDAPRVVVCDGSGCSWAVISDEDIDLAYGGDGEPDGAKTMTFDEDEVEDGFDFSDDEADEDSEGFDFTDDEADTTGFDFSEDDLSYNDVIPLGGSWTAIHEAGLLDCPGAFSMEIPAGDEQQATIEVAADGSSFRATDLDPETPQIDMTRVEPGLYHAELPIDTPEGAMTLMYDVGFFDPALAVGMIRAEMTTQGYECTVTRGVLILHESLDLMADGDAEDAPESEDVS